VSLSTIVECKKNLFSNNVNLKTIKFVEMEEKNLYIIAGCNGAGKTTASYTILPEIIECKEFVNADEIAKGLSPFQPEKVSFESGRIMINRINELLRENETFAFETTLSSKSYKNKILKARENGYTITLLFFWLNNIQLAKERVKTRVLEGGHHIPENVIERRYLKGIYNLFDIYLPIIDQALIFDNSFGKHELIAQKFTEENLIIIDENKFNKLKEFYDNKR
jgi:predicted ABC-type ATPase